MAKRRKNLEGSIRKRSNGTYRAYATVNGKRTSKTFTTQHEAVKWHRELQNQADIGLDIEEAKVTIEIFLTNWLVTVKSTLRTKTWDQYRQLVHYHILPTLGKIRLMDLKPVQIQNLYDSKVQQGTGLRTVELIHAVLRRSLNHALKLGIIPRNPTVATTPPKGRKKEQRILDEDQVQRLLITAKSNFPKDYFLYHLAISTGMRQGELLGLKFDDIKDNQIFIVRQVIRNPENGLELAEPKTDSGTRKVLIGRVTQALLIAHQENIQHEMKRKAKKWQDNNLIFPGPYGMPMNQRSVVRRFKQLLKDAALPNIRFHDLRHTAASLMLSKNVPLITVSKMLGHSKPSITLDYYGHLIPGMQEQAVAVMEEIVTLTHWEGNELIAPKLRREQNVEN